MSNENCIRKLENENLEYFEYEFCKIKEFNLKWSYIWYKLGKKRMKRREKR